VGVKTLADIGKMIKLENILKEIEIGIPLSKQNIADWWLNEGDVNLFRWINRHSSLKDLLDDGGYTSLEGMIDGDWADDYTDVEKTVEYVEAYYKMFKPKEIFINIFDTDGIYIKGISYKNIIINYIEDGAYYVFCNNF
jgi:hypothetical protein